MRQLLAITRKELENYFGSPLALIFLGSFIGVVLFIFFSVETFFARNVADVRPLFRWMPLLLVFLLAALTMRQWSEEQRAGTLEILLTLPVRPLYLVLGKFLAVMSLIGVALALTLPLPLTAALLGNLDWGPVFGGYLAALLLAAAYAALGLFISSRTDNQIVALILSVLVGGVLYLLGTPAVTDLFSGTTSRVLWGLGTGSRFESIERGVIDLRDLVYYLSLTVFFLLLNLLSIDSKRWSRRQRAYRQRLLTTAVLLTANLLLLNIWLTPLQGLRADLTATQEYSLSQTTYDLVGNLQEPLLIRGYISERTHPLLAPLTPRIEDMLREYEIAGRGMITAEVVDPITDPELENEANQLYGIQPRPYQIADRYESTVINSYFNILLQYGDQTIVLGFDDLVQTTSSPDGSVDVQLRNLEYDLTRGIKRVLFGFQSVDAVLAALDEPVELTLFITPESLPEWMSGAEETITAVAQEIEADAGGKFQFTVVNPDDPNSAINRTFLLETYGLPGIPVDVLSSETYYAHMLLANGENGQFIYPSGEITESGVRTAIESALKRSTTGFLKVVGLWTPPNAPLNDPVLGDVLQPMVSYQALQQQLGQEYTLQDGGSQPGTGAAGDRCAGAGCAAGVYRCGAVCRGPIPDARRLGGCCSEQLRPGV
jgi:ABC-2 type transport system permease protein